MKLNEKYVFSLPIALSKSLPKKITFESLLSQVHEPHLSVMDYPLLHPKDLLQRFLQRVIPAFYYRQLFTRAKVEGLSRKLRSSVKIVIKFAFQQMTWTLPTVTYTN